MKARCGFNLGTGLNEKVKIDIPPPLIKDNN